MHVIRLQKEMQERHQGWEDQGLVALKERARRANDNVNDTAGQVIMHEHVR